MKLLRSQKMASLSEDECNEYDVIFIQGRDRTALSLQPRYFIHPEFHHADDQVPWQGFVEGKLDRTLSLLIAFQFVGELFHGGREGVKPHKFGIARHQDLLVPFSIRHQVEGRDFVVQDLHCFRCSLLNDASQLI